MSLQQQVQQRTGRIGVTAVEKDERETGSAGLQEEQTVGEMGKVRGEQQGSDARRVDASASGLCRF